MACRTLVPRLGIEPVLPAVLTTGPPGKSLRNMNFKQSSWIFLINTNEVICMIKVPTFPFPWKMAWPQITLSFLLLILSYPTLLPYKSLLVCAAHAQSPLLVARWDAAWFMSHWMKPISSSNFLSRILFFLRDWWQRQDPKGTCSLVKHTEVWP